MIDVLKKTFLAGLGAGVVTAEKVESTLDDLVRRGRLTTEEAREAAQKIASESKQEYHEARANMSSIFDELLSRGNLASRSDLQALEARLIAIEAVLQTKEDKSGPDAGPASSPEVTPLP